MVTKESEGKFKNCPLLKTHDDKMKFCLGSNCMMWRWVDPDKTDSSDLGYCGLAGNPVSKP